MTTSDHPESLVSARDPRKVPHITRIEDGTLILNWPESWQLPTTEVTRELMIEMVARFNELNEIKRRHGDV